MYLVNFITVVCVHYIAVHTMPIHTHADYTSNTTELLCSKRHVHNGT